MMRILEISSIYPVKDSPLDNAYVKTFIKYYKAKNDAEFSILKPVTYFPKFIYSFLKKKDLWKNKLKLIEKSEYLEDNLNIKILPFISVGSISSLHAFLAMFIYIFNRRKIKSSNINHYDVIHAHYLFPDGLLALKLSRKYKIPYVLTIRQEMRFINSWFSRVLSRKIINNAKAVSTQSFQMHQLLKKQDLRTEIELLPTGIEDYFFSDQEKKTTSDENLKLVSVCNLVPIKNLDSVLLALNKIKDKSKISYTIYGNGPEEDKLKNLASELGLDDIVAFKGRVDNSELPEIYSHFDVFIQPSFKETFGLSYFEAMACGLPVILSENTGAYPLIKDKNVAFVINPKKVESISRCLMSILKDRSLLIDKSKNCREVSRIASWDNYIDFFNSYYHQIIDEKQ